MAQYQILNTSAPYVCVRVIIDGEQYDQVIISERTGADLETFLQTYADDYEAALRFVAGVAEK